jgi:hypothetical protein
MTGDWDGELNKQMIPVDCLRLVRHGDGIFYEVI